MTSPGTTRPDDETNELLPEDSLLAPALKGGPVAYAAEDLATIAIAGAGAEPAPDFQLPGIDNRERALPIRQGDLTRMLLAEPALGDDDRRRLEEFGKILSATFHSEFFAILRELKELYAPLDPDSDYVDVKGHGRPRTEHSDEDFLVPFRAALERANYRPLALRVIEQAVSAPNEMGLTYIPDFSLFEHLDVYVRGFTRITRACRNARTRFRKRTVVLDAYQRLVIALKFKPSMDLGPFVRSDVLYLRMFKDVPHVDMEMHLPEQGTKVRMRWIDRAQIASPFVMGLPTLAIKLLGVGALGALLSPVALGGLLVAPISAGVNSFFGFHRAKQKHLYAMIHRLYYLTLANNACALTRLVDSAEDEDYKETMLAYYFLWRGPGDGSTWTVPALDARIEDYLREKTGIEINFEVGDALDKLFRLGLASQDPQGGLRATAIDQALTILDRHWDDTFQYPLPGRLGARASSLEHC
jgi:hypothetical protein